MPEYFAEIESAWKAFPFFCHQEKKTGQKITANLEKNDPKDVHQGSLGDCWLMAALSCLSDHPQKLKSLFSSRHITEDLKHPDRLMIRPGMMRCFEQFHRSLGVR